MPLPDVFAAIRRRLFPRLRRREAQEVLGLNPDQQDTLLALRGHPGWAHLVSPGGNGGPASPALAGRFAGA